jgi:orotate phosphoribosyltransferase
VSDDKRRLLQLLRELSYRKGRVVLSSGKVSDFYVDGKQTLLNAEGAAAVGRLVLSMIRQDPSDIVGVGGMTMGADPIATATSVLSTLDGGAPLSAFYVRKEAKVHGTQAYLEGLNNFPDRGRVVVVEDTSTTGGSAWKAVERTRDAGFDVAWVVTIVDRQEGAVEFLAERGVELRALVTRADIEGGD